MLEAALFRHDRVPGHVLHLALDGLSVKIRELHARGGDYGEVAIGKKENVAGVIKDGGYVGSDKVFVIAQATTRGGPLRAATILFGSSTEITPRANTPLSSFTVRRTASSSVGWWPLPVLKRYFSIR